MSKPQYAILRFAKYKGPEIGRIEAHDERTKEILRQQSRRGHGEKPSEFPPDRAVRQIPGRGRKADRRRRVPDALRQRAGGGNTRHRQPGVLSRARRKSDVKAFFERALEFMTQKQSKQTILSAVVHMDEKTPHMHLSFVPLTADGRLSAKEILGNRKS
jgi:hypothetical protein